MINVKKLHASRRPKRASDAELIDGDVYGSDRDFAVETEPTGLVDRLASEDMSAPPTVAPGPMSSQAPAPPPPSALAKYQMRQGMQPGMDPAAADPFKGGMSAPPMPNPQTSEDEFDPRKRPYLMGGR